MTSIEWLIDQLIPEDQHEGIMDIIEDAKEMHKQEIIDAYSQCGRDNFEHIKVINRSATEYYQETFGSKGSDATKEESKQETLEESTNIDFSLFKKGFFKWQQEQQLPQQEISDEEIEDVAWERYTGDSAKLGFIEGCKWYREQLKQL